MTDKTGDQLRDEGVDQNLEARGHELFPAEARAIIDALIALNRNFDSDDVWDRMPAGIAPSHPNVLPSIFNKYARAEKIVAVGYKPSRRKSRHSGVIRVWKPKEQQ